MEFNCTENIWAQNIYSEDDITKYLACVNLVEKLNVSATCS